MKKVCLLIAILSATLFLSAQEYAVNAPRLKVGVVFGGGGAKGAAHIGVLKYMEELGIPIDYVAGTSMGSIIGGLYALGYTPDQLTELISGMDWSAYIGNKIDRSSMSYELRKRSSTTVLMVPFSFGSLLDNNSNASFISQLPSAYVNNSSLINLFNDLCVGYQEEMDFNDLPIPFACVATDMISGKEVVLRSGSVPTAMRASMAIPGVFSPVQMEDQVLVDGGLVNNFPADVLREMGADIIIGVEITSTKDVTAEDLQSLPQVFGRLVTNTTSSKREENRGLCTLYMVPDVSGYGMLSFTPDAIDTLVGRGYKKASEYHEQLMRIKSAVEASAGHSVAPMLHAPKAKNIAVDTVMIRRITINNVSPSQSRWLLRKGKLDAGKRYTQKSIEHAMQVYRGTGCFDEITYGVKLSDTIRKERELDGFYNLDVNMKPAKPHIFGLGIRYDTEEGAALLLSLGLNEKKFNGLKFNTNFKLSYSPKINMTLTYAVPSIANFSLAYDYRNEHFRIYGDADSGLNMRYHQNKVSGYISQFHLLNLSTQVGLSYAKTSFDLSLTEGSILDTLVFAPSKFLAPFVSVTYDNLDDAYFAKRGIRARLTARYHFDMDKSKAQEEYYSSDGYFDLACSIKGYIMLGNSRFCIIPQYYGRIITETPLYYNLWNVYGGEIEGRHFDEQLPFVGLLNVNATSYDASVLRLDLRYNLFGNHYLTATYNTMAYLLRLFYEDYHFADAFDFADQGAGIKYSYYSPLGPISLTAHWANTGSINRFGAYFSFGYTF